MVMAGKERSVTGLAVFLSVVTTWEPKTIVNLALAEKKTVAGDDKIL